MAHLVHITGQNVNRSASLSRPHCRLHSGSRVHQQVGSGAGTGDVKQPIRRAALRISQIIPVHSRGLTQRRDIDEVALRLLAASLGAIAFHRFPYGGRYTTGENSTDMA